MRKHEKLALLKSKVNRRAYLIVQDEKYCDCPHCPGCGDEAYLQVGKVSEVDFESEEFEFYNDELDLLEKSFSTQWYDVDEVGQSIFFNKKDATLKLKEINSDK